jgi:hypothetical protein
VAIFIGGSIDGFMWWVFKYFVSGFVGYFWMGLKVMNKWFWGGFLLWFINYVLVVTSSGSKNGLSEWFVLVVLQFLCNRFVVGCHNGLLGVLYMCVSGLGVVFFSGIVVVL